MPTTLYIETKYCINLQLIILCLTKIIVIFTFGCMRRNLANFLTYLVMMLKFYGDKEFEFFIYLLDANEMLTPEGCLLEDVKSELNHSSVS